MATIKQRLDRALKTSALRSLRFNKRAKILLTRRRNTIFISCFPKSGSTFLVSIVAEATGYIQQFLGFDALNEQDLYLPKLIDTHNMNIVCHQHTRATKSNLELMNEFEIQPIILVRNIFDCLVSLRDHLEKESLNTPVFSGGKEFLSKSPAKQIDELIDMVLPWYINFIKSWKSAEENGLPILWLNYEEVTSNATATVKRILYFYSIDIDDRQIDKAISNSNKGIKTRFNKGISGRGYSELSSSQRQKIIDCFRHYRDLDLNSIGVLPVSEGGLSKR